MSMKARITRELSKATSDKAETKQNRSEMEKAF